MRLHGGDGADERHRRLTDAERMQRNAVRLLRQMAHHFHQIVDVIVEIEDARPPGRHRARVAPIGDVDVVARQEGLDRAAQQRGVMARHGRDQAAVSIGAARPRRTRRLKCSRPQKGRLPNDLLDDLDLGAVDHRRVQAEHRLAVAARHALEQLGRRGEVAAERGVIDSGLNGFLMACKHRRPSPRAPARKPDATFRTAGRTADPSFALSPPPPHRQPPRCFHAALHNPTHNIFKIAKWKSGEQSSFGEAKQDADIRCFQNDILHAHATAAACEAKQARAMAIARR